MLTKGFYFTEVYQVTLAWRARATAAWQHCKLLQDAADIGYRQSTEVMTILVIQTLKPIN